MSVIWDCDIEAGDLTEFAGQISDDISAAAAAALAGTSYGLSVLVNDTTDNYVYPTTLSPVNTAGKCRIRFYFDPNSLTMAADNNLALYIQRGGGNNLALVSLVYLGSQYRIYVTIYNDAGGTSQTEASAITDAPHYIEAYLIRATNSTSSDGSLQLWIDGADIATLSGVDNYDRFTSFNSYRWGAISKAAGTSGTFYLDQLVVNDDGGAIGALAGAITGTAQGAATQTGTLTGTGTGALAGTSAGASSVVLIAPYLDSILALFTTELVSYLPFDDTEVSLSGAASGTSSQAGTLSGAGALSGAVAGVAAQTGALTGAGALNGVAQGTATAAGSVAGAGSLSGAAAGIATQAGTLTGLGSSALNGAATGAATQAGMLLGAGALAGSSAGVVTLSGVALGTGALVGAATGTAAVIAAPSYSSGTTGAIVCLTDAVATLSANGALYGYAVASATSDVTLTADGILIGSVVGTCYVVGTLYDGSYHAPGTRTIYKASRRVTAEVSVGTWDK